MGIWEVITQAAVETYKDWEHTALELHSLPSEGEKRRNRQ